MKRTIALLLVLAMAFTLCACGNKVSKEDQEKLDNIKFEAEAELLEMIADAVGGSGVSETLVARVLNSLTVVWGEEELNDDEFSIPGEMTYIIGDTKYIYPVTVSGEIDSRGKVSFGEQRTETVSAEEQAAYEAQEESNKLSDAEKEQLAEKKALEAVLDSLESDEMYYKRYNIDDTRYDIGKISIDGDSYTVKGTLYLYDNNGSFATEKTFTAQGSIDDEGHAYNNYVNID